MRMFWTFHVLPIACFIGLICVAENNKDQGLSANKAINISVEDLITNYPETKLPDTGMYTDILIKFRTSGLKDETTRWLCDIFHIEPKAISCPSEMDTCLYKTIPVTLKAVSKTQGIMASGMGSIERESLISALVRHLPGMVTMFGFRVDTEPKFLVLQRLTNHDGSLSLPILETLQKEKSTLSSKDVIQICTRLVKTIIGCHELGILHQNINENDIYMQRLADKSFRPYLLNFSRGIFSNEIQPLDTSQAAQGEIKRYPHIAPELFLGGSKPSPVSEAYSVGKVLQKVASVTDNKIVGQAGDMLANHWSKRATLPYVYSFLSSSGHLIR